MLKNKFLSIILLSLMVFAGFNFAGTVWVNTTTTGCSGLSPAGTSFNTIQNAIGYLAQPPGATNASSSSSYNLIVVCRNGTTGHFENVEVNLSTSNNISIVGNESTSTLLTNGVIIRAFDTTKPIFNVTGSNVLIANFTFEGRAGTVQGIGVNLIGNISVHEVENVTLENSSFLNITSRGITVAANRTLFRNLIFGVGSDGRVVGNISAGMFYGGSGAAGAVSDSAIRNVSLLGNASVISQSAQNSWGIRFGDGTIGVNITNTTIQNFTWGIISVPSSTGAFVPNMLVTTITGVSAAGAQQNIIFNNTFGIYINRTLLGATVRNNQIFNNTYNVVLENASYVNIVENNITNGQVGLYLSGTNNNATSNNITNATTVSICINNDPQSNLAVTGQTSFFNISVRGGNVRSLTYPTSVAMYSVYVSCATSTLMAGVGSAITGVSINDINIIGGTNTNAQFTNNPSTIGVYAEGYAINLSFANISGFNTAVYMVLGSTGGSTLSDDTRFNLINASRIFNNTRGINTDYSTGLNANLDINNTKVFNNSEYGVLIAHNPTAANGVLIYNLTAYENKFGVYLNQTSNATITASAFANNSLTGSYAIVLESANTTTLSNNTFNMSGASGHIRLLGSSRNTFSDNSFRELQSSAVEAISLINGSNHTTISGGFIRLNSTAAYGIYMNNSINLTVQAVDVIMSASGAPTVEGVIAINSHNVTMNFTNVSRFTTGFYGALQSANSASYMKLLSSRLFNNSDTGLYLAGNSSATGYLRNVDVNNTFSTNNTNYDLYFDTVQNGLVFDSVFNLSNVGMYLTAVDDLRVTSSNISNNSVTAANTGQIVIAGNSGNLNFTGNNVSSNVNRVGYHIEHTQSTYNVRITGGVILNASIGIYVRATTTAGITVNDVSFTNSTAAGFYWNGSAAAFNLTNSRFINCNRLGSQEGCVFINNSPIFNMSTNNITNVSGIAINLYRTVTSAFAENNITNVTLYGVLINASAVTFAGDNYIFMNNTVSGQKELYLEGGNITTYSSATQFNITTPNLIFALNSSRDISIKVVNVSQNVNDSLYLVNEQVASSSAMLEPLNNNAGLRQFKFGLNVSNTSSSSTLSPVFYFNSTTYASVNGTVSLLYSTIGQNWTSIVSSVDTTLLYAAGSASTQRPYGYIVAGTYVLPSTASSSTSDSATSEQKTQPSVTYKFVCPDNKLQVSATGKDGAVATDLTFKLFRTSPGFDLLETKSSDSSGSASFLIDKAGSYDVDASGSKYITATISVSTSLCNVGEAGIVKEGTSTDKVNVTTTVDNEGNEQPVVVPEVTKQQVLDAIAAADSEISSASKAGKDVSGAKSALSNANNELNLGNFKSALKLALEAQSLAKSASPLKETPSTPTKAPVVPSKTPEAKGFDFGSLAIPVLVIIIVIAGVYFFTKKGGDKGYKKGFKS